MEELILLHNPKAGEEDHDKEMLIKSIENAGFHCTYISLKERRWKNFRSVSDILVVAGGDGSVRKVAKYLLSRSLLEKRFMLAILPMGTANNIAKSLQISIDWPQSILSWQKSNLKELDIGSVYNLRGSRFFLEGMGYGLIPRLIKKMDGQKMERSLSAEEELKVALQTLKEIAKTSKAKFTTIRIDKDVVLTGHYLMVEVMNLPFVGPNLNLAPHADPSDGRFNLVLLAENKRQRFIDFLDAILMGKQPDSPCQVILGSHFELKWDGQLVHFDDELIETKRIAKLRIEVRKRVLQFLV